MNGQAQFTWCRMGALLALIAAAWPMSVWGVSAGRLDFVVGQATATGGDGKSRVLTRGGEINAGDLIQTGADGRVQIRFADGAYMSLQPNTRFKVDDYRYSGKADGSEKSVFSLLKGGLRTISGNIGKVNRDAYRVTTPAATIGIRGTGYHANVNGGLQVHVTQGAVALKNDGGELVVGAGQTGVAKDFNTAPQFGFQSNGPSGDNGGGSGKQAAQEEKKEEKQAGGSTPPATYVAGDTVQSSGDPVVVPVPPPAAATLPSGNGYAFAMASNKESGWMWDVSDAEVTMAPAGRLSAFRADGGEGWVGYGLGTASVVTEYTGADEYIAWGTWANGTLEYLGDMMIPDDSLPLSGNERFTYVTGAPTPVGALPGGTASYSLLGASQVAGTDGALGSVTAANLSVDFGLSKITGMDFTLNITSGAHQGAKTLIADAANLDQDFWMSGNTFSGYLFSSSGCVGGCSAYVSGFFAGPGAVRAGFAYDVYETGTVRYFQGTVAVKKN